MACGDFTEGGKKLIESAHLKNTCYILNRITSKKLKNLASMQTKKQIISPREWSALFMDCAWVRDAP